MFFKHYLNKAKYRIHCLLNCLIKKFNIILFEDLEPTSSPSGRISHPRPGAFQPVSAGHQQQPLQAARPPEETAEQQRTVSTSTIPERKRR